MRHTICLACLGACLLLAACGNGEEDADRAGSGERLRVAAAFYPLEEIARSVGGDRVRVTGLTPPGSGPHDLELRAPQLVALQEADAVVFLGGNFQPAVQQSLDGLPDDVVRADVLDGARLRPVDAAVPGVRGEVDGEVIAGDKDPHVWVDPARYGQIVEAVRAALTKADPDAADTFQRNANAYQAKVRALDAEFDGGLKNCRTRTLVTSHAAFGYLADRYDLQQAPIAGISPDDEPDPRSLAATARKAKADGVTTVFFESLVPRDLSQTVAEEIGARTDALDPVEGLTREQLDAGESYFTVQRDNLRRLRKGLQCTG